MTATELAAIIRAEVTAAFPMVKFTVKASSSAGARYVRVTVKSTYFDLSVSKRGYHSLTTSFGKLEYCDYYNNGTQLTPDGFALLSDISKLITKYAGRSTFISLEVGTPTVPFEVK